MSSDEFPVTERTKIRVAARGSYDRDTVHGILDEGLVCHLGLVDDGAPYVIPTSYVRIDDHLYVHGSPATRMLRSVQKGGRICVTVTLLDGLVLARSAFHHSMNYRSVVVIGEARLVKDLAEKRRVLDALVEHVVPGRTPDTRGASADELKFTKILALPIEEASAKLRRGGPIDEPEDLARDDWAGVIPLSLVPGAPIADAAHPPQRPAPSYATGYRRPV